MVARSRARYLAPIALAATLTATYLVVRAAVSENATTRSHLVQHRTRGGKFARAKFYVVKTGDSLSTISAKTSVPLPTLESLNPSVNTQSLQIGQRLRLRR